MSFSVGDSVRIINGTSAVPSGSVGEVTAVAGNNVQVDFGPLLGTLMTTAQNLQPAVMASKESMTPSATAPPAAPAGGSPSRKIHWAAPTIGVAAGVAPASISATPAPSNAMTVLFNDPAVDLQGAAALTAIWATMLTFAVSGDLQKKAPVTVAVRAFVATSKKASVVLLVYLDGKLHRKEFNRGKVRSDNVTWQLRQTLQANATSQIVSMVVLAERASPTESVTVTIDSLDLALAEVLA